MHSSTSLRPSGAFSHAATCTKRSARVAAVAPRAMSDLQKPAVRPAAPAVPAAAAPPAPAPAAVATSSSPSGVTIEYQRQQAKAMQQYFRDQKLDEAIMDAQVFGWTRNNEIGNGRWVMMGLAIGLLTEYATAVNFIDQIKLMVSYLGIADLD